MRSAPLRPLALALIGLLTVAGCVAGGPAAAAAPPAPGAPGTFDRFSFTNAAGTRTYKVFVPPSYDGSALPLLVDLHGCGSNADEEARWSRFNALAAARRILVAYPEQDANANGSRCWNWFLPAHQSRDAGEASIIAGITRAVMSRWKVDARAVYLAGISAGGAMTVNMAATYPDLYAAAMVYAGCEYKGTTCLGAVAALPAEVSGQMAYAAMGPRARVVPVFVIQGDLDPVVPAPNAELVVQQFLAADDWADNGANDASIRRTRSATRQGAKPGGQSYEIDDYTDGAGCLVARRWLVRGMLHQWSNAESNGTPRDTALTDPAGPDVSTPTLDFLLAYRMPVAGKTCSAALASPPPTGAPIPAPVAPRGTEAGGDAGGDAPPTLAVGGGSGPARVALLGLVGFLGLRLAARRRIPT